MRRRLSIQQALLIIVAAVTFVLSPTTSTAHPGLHHDWAEATRQLEERPFDAEPRLQRSRLARLEGRVLEAYFEARWARALAPAHPDPWRALGLAAKDLDRRDEAASALDAYFAAGGLAFDARVARAELWWSAGRGSAAVRDLDLALAGRPDVEVALQRARWLRTLQRLDDAANGLAAVLSRVQDALLIRRALVRLHVDRNRPFEALVLINEALVKRPDALEWYLARAEILRRVGRPHESKAALAQAQAVANAAADKRPSSLTLAGRARVRQALGDRRGARRDLQLARTLGPVIESTDRDVEPLAYGSIPKERP